MSTSFWDQSSFYGVDLTKAKSTALKEAYAQPIVGYFSPNMLVSDEHVKHVIDFSKVSEKDGFEKIRIPFSFTVSKTSIVHGMACWFDVKFLVHRLLCAYQHHHFPPIHIGINVDCCSQNLLQ